MMGSDSIVTWGYAKGFVIEYDNTLKKRIDCESCLYFEKSDKTCLKKQLYLPVDGFDSWKNCNCFSLDKGTSNKEGDRSYVRIIWSFMAGFTGRSWNT